MKQAIFAKWLLAITTTHLLLGVVIFYSSLLQLIQSGWWNTVGPNNLETAVAFWFMLFGFALLMVVGSMWGSDRLVTRGFLYANLIGSVVVGLAMPFSGIWTLTLLCAIALIMSKGKSVSGKGS